MKWIIILFGLSLYSQNIENDRIDSILKAIDKPNTSQKQRIWLNSEALKLLSQAPNNLPNRKLLIKTGFNFKKLNCWAELKETSRILLQKSNEAKFTEHIGISYKLLGYYFTYTSKNDSALYYFLKARKYFLLANDKSNLSANYSDVGLIYFFNCDYLESQLSYINALKFVPYSKRKDEDEYIAYVNLGIINTIVGEYEKAIDNTNKALLIAEKKLGKSDCYIENCLNEIGYNYYKIGQYRKSIILYEKALRSLKAPNNYPELYSLILDNLANSRLSIGERKDVYNIYMKASHIRDYYNVDQGKNYNKLFLSKYFYELGQKEKALSCAHEALRLSREFEATKDILICLQQLLRIDTVDASKYLEEYFFLSDSLQLAERKNRNKFARIAFETDEITFEKDKAVKQKWIVAGISGALLLLGTLLLIIITQRARQKRLLLVQEQQKADESIYQLINDQQLKVDEGRQAEKKRIARELHDGIMNRLASTRLNLFILNVRQDKETINKCLGFINNIQDIEKEIRQVAHDLNDEIFSENKGFVLLLETLFEEYRNINDTKLFTEIDPAFNWEMTESVLRMNIYRILQEALQNSYKYANARNIFVTLTKEEDSVRIIVHDDGKGFDTGKVKKGLGLQSIADRVESLKGFFKIISGKQEGTILNILLPLKT